MYGYVDSDAERLMSFCGNVLAIDLAFSVWNSLCFDLAGFQVLIRGLGVPSICGAWMVLILRY